MRNTRNKQKGFTIIELLVVVAIIGLLAVASYDAVVDSRDKAKNTRKNEIALQYFKAFQLHIADGNDYPITGNSVCLGYEQGTGDYCRGSYQGNTSLNTILSEHYPDMPKDDAFAVEYLPGQYARGIEYDCAGTGACYLNWYLKGSHECVAGASRVTNGTYTQCNIEISIY